MKYYTYMQMKQQQQKAVCGLILGFPGGLVVRNMPVNAGDIIAAVSIPGWVTSWVRAWAIHSHVTLPGIPWTEGPSGLQSHGIARS